MPDMTNPVKVVRHIEHVRASGYVDTDEVHVQRLMERRRGWFGTSRWVEIDREIIPTHAVISMGAFGDAGGWKSRFAAHI